MKDERDAHVQEEESIYEHIKITLSNQRQHLFPLSLLLATSSVIGLLIFFSYYFDEDAVFQVLIPLKLSTLSLKNIRPYAMLFPVILLVNSSYLNPLIGFLILGISSGVGTAFLVYWITISQTNNRIMGILCMLLILIINGFQLIFRSLDDNIFPLPFILLSFYLIFIETQQSAENRRKLRTFGGGLLLSIAIAFHLQMVILMPLLVFFPFTDYRIRLKHRLLNSLIAFLGIVSFFIPLFFLLMNARGLLSIEILTSPSKYIPFVFTGNLLAKKQTDTNLIGWIFQWLEGMITFSSPFILFDPPGILFFIPSIIWFGFIIGIPLYSVLKLFQEQKKSNLFVTWGFMAFIMTCIYTIIFEAENPERWTQAIPFLVINLGIGLDKVGKTTNFWNRISQKFNITRILEVFSSPKRWISNYRLFGFLMVCLVLAKYYAGFGYAVLSPTVNDWPDPNKIIIDEIVQIIPENAPLILGEFFKWQMVSYYHFVWTIYVHWDGQLQEAVICENERWFWLVARYKLNESSISSLLRTCLEMYLDRGIVVFAHEDAIPYLKAQGFHTDYNLIVYKEFSHWSPLDLIKSERIPNRIYTLTRRSEG